MTHTLQKSSQLRQKPIRKLPVKRKNPKISAFIGAVGYYWTVFVGKWLVYWACTTSVHDQLILFYLIVLFGLDFTVKHTEFKLCVFGFVFEIFCLRLIKRKNNAKPASHCQSVNDLLMH